MKPLPHGWNEQYTLRWLHEAVCNLQEQQGPELSAAQILGAIDDLKGGLWAITERLATLEGEIARLDVEKANRAGRKPVSRDGTRAQDNA